MTLYVNPNDSFFSSVARIKDWGLIFVVLQLKNVFQILIIMCGKVQIATICQIHILDQNS